MHYWYGRKESTTHRANNQAIGLGEKMNSSQDEKVGPHWWSDFWKEGAFLRISERECLLWRGPWVALGPTQEHENDSNFSVGLMTFFESEISRFIASGSPLKIEISTLLPFFDKMIQAQPTTVSKDLFRWPLKEEFEKNFQMILGKIQREEIDKAVPNIFAKSVVKPSFGDIASWMKKVLTSNSNLKPYGFWNQNSGVLGATPEILFQLEDNKLKTVALAGTLPRAEVATRISLLKDPKELYEHQLVVNDIQQQLEKVGVVKKTEVRILELPQMFHLFTEFEVEFRDKTVKDFVRLLHPTPALGVSPRRYGYFWMKELLDQGLREKFGAPIVFNLNENKVTAVVAIRNIQWNQNGCLIGAGCGLVRDSQLDREWNELQHKLKSVFEMLGL